MDKLTLQTVEEIDALNPDHSRLPAQDRSYRVPSLPRLIVPPSVKQGIDDPDLVLVPFSATDYSAGDFDNFDLLEKLTFPKPFGNSASANWRYEWRRNPQKILPFVYLGPMTAAKDKDFLQGEGITMLLAIRNNMSAFGRFLAGSKVGSELGIKSETIDVAGNQELITAFPQAINIINNHLSDVNRQQTCSPLQAQGDASMPEPENPKLGKVLIYCESGNERSAAVVVAYILAMYDLDVVKAIQFVQSGRFCVNFDDALKNLLITFAEIVEAKRKVARAQHPTAASNPLQQSLIDEKPYKRKLDTLNSDMLMSDAAEQLDEGRFHEREGSAPFIDHRD
ncbi:MAG: hypothetical protein M1837_006877 [Sclerophora amabilis]|nr:MAG: hypothetical protein M1837_006877 [Sclerophora amabilis]